MDIKGEGLIVTPTDEEIIGITQGFGIRDPRIKTIKNRPVLEENAEIDLYSYEEHRVLSPRGTVGRIQQATKQGPANVVFLTSIRDVGRYDLNGIDLMGMIETANNLINECTQLDIGEERLNLGDFIRIRGIITDDLDTENLGPYPVTPMRGKPWIHPLDARNDNGDYLKDITTRIRSDFRATPGGDKQLAKQRRLEFEDEIFRVSKQMGADILVSDHLMVRLIHLIEETKYSIGRVLNIHPGISDPTNPSKLQGSTPTLDAIDRAKWGAIYNKKRGLFLPANMFLPPDQQANRFGTGASLHIIDEGLDTGPVIADSESTWVSPNDRPQKLRRRNYPLKRTVFVAGIIHYVRTMLSRIDKINFRYGERTTTKAKIKQE